METYKGTINEYIDWTTGIDSITGNRVSGVTEETPISGKSIRELLQSHIKTPFVTYKDDKGGYIRFFSLSEISLYASISSLSEWSKGKTNSVSTGRRPGKSSLSRVGTINLSILNRNSGSYI